MERKSCEKAVWNYLHRAVRRWGWRWLEGTYQHSFHRRRKHRCRWTFKRIFSLLFNTTKVFEGNTFSVDPQLLDSKHSRLIGKAVGKAIISGHPDPRCLNHHVTQYILQGQEPDFSNIQTKEIFMSGYSKGYHWCKEPMYYIVNFGKKCALVQVM